MLNPGAASKARLKFAITRLYINLPWPGNLLFSDIFINTHVYATKVWWVLCYVAEQQAGLPVRNICFFLTNLCHVLINTPLSVFAGMIQVSSVSASYPKSNIGALNEKSSLFWNSYRGQALERGYNTSWKGSWRTSRILQSTGTVMPTLLGYSLMWNYSWSKQELKILSNILPLSVWRDVVFGQKSFCIDATTFIFI